MNWKLVFSLGSFGLAMGLLSLFGLTRHGVEPLLWLVIALVSAFLIAKRAVPRPFLHGLLVGILAGVSNGVVQVAGFDVYLANNPEAAQAMAQAPAGVDPRIFVLVATPFIGSAYGLLLGAIAWVIGRTFRRREALRR